MSDEIRQEMEEVEETEVIETEQEELETEELEGDEPTDEQDEEQPAPQDSVPLAKFMAEKKKRQEAERLLQDKAMQDELNQRKTEKYRDYLNRGYPEQEAWRLADESATREADDKRARDKYESKLFEIELKELARTDQFFADAETFKDEIRAKMKKFDCSLSEAYMLVRGPSRTREVTLQTEQRAKAKQAQAKPRNIATSTAQPMKSKYNLDADDRKALAELQKAQPGAGWTVEKYHKIMKE